MLFLKSWLEDYIDLSGYTNIELARLISIKSSEVEEVKIIDDYYNQLVVVGRITNVTKHPEADSLNYFDVIISPDSQKSVRIVSAASNVREGLIVPVALVGANLAGNIVTAKKMRGIESNGLCLGQSELNLETPYSQGLWELEGLSNNDLGRSIVEVYPKLFPQQIIFDIKILPDKIAKIGNHLGMAIEIAIVCQDLSLLKGYAKSLTNHEELSKMVGRISSINIPDSETRISLADEAGYCQAFSMFDVQLDNNFSLDYLKRQRMTLISENLTDTIADLSNYIQLDVGQPSHFFKSEIIQSSSLVIDRLSNDTPWQGLGQLKDTLLPKNAVVLRDDNTILAVPAVSGGAGSSVSKGDTRIKLELASFNYEAVGRNSFLIGYRSSAAKLYCSDVAEFNSVIALEKILQELHGLGDVSASLNFLAGNNIDFKSWLLALNQPTVNSIEVNYQYVNSRLGKQDYSNMIDSAISLLGFVDGKTLRPFASVSLIHTQEDIVREVSRVIGYDKFDDEYIPSNTQHISNKDYYSLLKIKEYITSYGFYEIITRPFIHDKYLPLFDNTDRLLRLHNPYRDSVEIMRCDLDISVLEALTINLRDGYKEAAVFELGKVYHQDGSTVMEKNLITCAIVGEEQYRLTSMINQLLTQLYGSNYNNSIVRSKIGLKYIYTTNGCEIASITEVANKVKKTMDLPLNKKIFLASINLPQSISNISDYKMYRDESSYPVIRRSYNLILAKDHSTKELIDSLLAQQLDYTVIINPIERLPINDNTDKVLINVRYQSYSKTLSNNDVQILEDIINQYVK
jgi:phenylalanyl-tRNA synthetase beta chain